MSPVNSPFRFKAVVESLPWGTTSYQVISGAVPVLKNREKHVETLPDREKRPRINEPSCSEKIRSVGIFGPLFAFGFMRLSAIAWAIIAVLLLSSGCAATQERREKTAAFYPPCVLVVAPVLNLSGTEEFDPLQFTDILAAELVSFPGVTVIPVNLTLAALARAGKTRVEAPQDALQLAQEFGATATVVAAVTAYDPYDPPTVGLILQWYERPWNTGQAAQAAELSGAENPPLRWQVQSVFNAADEVVQERLKHFVKEREHEPGPYGWRKYVKSQKLYVRYCCWEIIRTMLRQQDRPEPKTAATPDEAES